MFSEIEGRVKKTHQAPGTFIYTGEKKDARTHFSLLFHDGNHYELQETANFADLLPHLSSEQPMWLNISGLNNISVIQQIASHFQLHALTIEDILNVTQRPKLEKFDNYQFVILKLMAWQSRTKSFNTKQLSLILAKNVVITFLESDYPAFNQLLLRFKQNYTQIFTKQKADYIAYRIIDTVIDEYFLVLEAIGDQIEKIEEKLINYHRNFNAEQIYKLKRQMLLLRKAIWPAREVVNHLTHSEDSNNFVSKNTRFYFRDVYDHIAQAIDSIDTFRDMLASLLDMYLSGLSNRMNEVMKILAIISTIFIPITSLASIYGMNFSYMPGIHSESGFAITILTMIASVGFMLFYFYRKEWL